jgi:hypothetical protein
MSKAEIGLLYCTMQSHSLMDASLSYVNTEQYLLRAPVASVLHVFITKYSQCSSRLHIGGVVVLNGGHDALDELEEDEKVLIHRGRVAHLLERLDDRQHCGAMLARMD